MKIEQRSPGILRTCDQCESVLALEETDLTASDDGYGYFSAYWNCAVCSSKNYAARLDSFPAHWLDPILKRSGLYDKIPTPPKRIDYSMFYYKSPKKAKWHTQFMDALRNKLVKLK